MITRHVYAAVALCAVVVHLGALWNGFALDDVYIVANNPLVRSPDGLWRAFAEPYWPGNLTGQMYRPLVIATFALDGLTGSPAWFHFVNLTWHAGSALLVAALAQRWAGTTAALAAGLIFAVHPVHVEAVANVVGRAELMAAAFTLLAVYAALVRNSIGWSIAATGAGLLCKENAAVIPALIAWGWVVGLIGPPSRRRLAAWGVSWVALALVYAAVRWTVLHEFAGFETKAPVFIGHGPVAMRLTAIAAFADVARLLLLPLHLRADYSPLERTVVTSVLDGRFALGILILTAVAVLAWLAWRRGRRVEVYGLGWVAIAFLPVANLLFPTGILLAERTLYVPSAGLALAAGAWLAQLQGRRLAVVLSLLVAAGAARTAFRVPVWRDNRAASLALMRDAPQSYRTWDYVGWELVWAGRSERALQAFLRASELYPRDARIYLAAAHMAYTLDRFALADSLLDRADQVCERCVTSYRNQAGAARLRGDNEAADSLLARADRLARGR